MLTSNVKIFGLYDSIIASGYPMLKKSLTEDEYEQRCDDLRLSDLYEEIIDNKDFCRINNLANTPMGSGHQTALCGIIVQFDLNFTIKAWTEFQRYHFADIISSMSTMHRITSISENDDSFIEYVDKRIIEILREKADVYNNSKDPEDYLKLLYSCPVGTKLTARITTNYLQLKTMYKQRKNHRLPEWRSFTKWMLTLPHFEELCLEKNKGEEK